MMRFIKNYLFLCIVVLSSTLSLGCAPNKFSTYYSGSNLEVVQANPRYVVHDTVSSGELPDLPSDEIVKAIFVSGYEPIGGSTWQGAFAYGNDDAIEQAKEIGASRVLWRADFSHTNSGLSPRTHYYGGERVTAYHTHKVYSEGKVHKVRTRSTMRMPTYTRTEYVPYSIDIYNYNSLFLAKLRPENFGVLVTEPSEDYRRKFDTSFGALVVAVQKDGRAYQENILEGDIIETINGGPVRYSEALKWATGENAVQIYRDGKKLSKNVFMGSQSIRN